MLCVKINIAVHLGHYIVPLHEYESAAATRFTQKEKKRAYATVAGLLK